VISVLLCSNVFTASPSVYLPPCHPPYLTIHSYIYHISYHISYIIYQVSGDGSEGVILRGNTIKNTGNMGASVMDGSRHSVEGKTMNMGNTRSGCVCVRVYVCVSVPYVPHSPPLPLSLHLSLPLPSSPPLYLQAIPSTTQGGAVWTSREAIKTLSPPLTIPSLEIRFIIGSGSA
jgi:hypothetical protein